MQQTNPKESDVEEIKNLVKETVEGKQNKRKIFAFAAFAAVAALVLIVFIALGAFWAPSIEPVSTHDSCSNGLIDQGEAWIDCGGACPKECPPESEQFSWFPFSASNIFVDSERNLLFIVDEYRHRVIALDSESFGYRGVIGHEGSRSGSLEEKGLFMEPNAFALSEQGIYAVLDRVPNRIQFFDSSLSFLHEIKDPQSFGGSELLAQKYHNLEFDSSGKLYLVHYDAILVFNPDFSFEKKLPDSSGCFDIAFDNEGFFYVSRLLDKKVEKRDRNFNLVATFDSLEIPGFSPRGIEFANDRVFVADYENGNVVVMGSDLAFENSFGNFTSPTAVEVSDKGKTFVLDIAEETIFVFDSSFKPVAELAATRATVEADGFWPRFVAIGEGDFIYVAEDHNDRLIKFSPDLRPVKIVGGSGTGDTEFRSPRGLFYWQGKIFIMDRENNRVGIFSDDLNFIGSIKRPIGNGEGEFNKARSVAVDSQGRVFVADTENHRVQVFSQQGNFINSIGKQGAGSEEFNSPRTVDIGPDDFLYVADSKNNAIKVFDTELEFVRSIDVSGIKPDGIRQVLVHNESIWFVDTGNGRILHIDMEGNLLDEVGEANSRAFNHPRGIAIDSTGRIFVGDQENGRLVVLNPDFSHFASVVVDDNQKFAIVK